MLTYLNGRTAEINVKTTATESAWSNVDTIL